jgi:hypothetical protein
VEVLHILEVFYNTPIPPAMVIGGVTWTWVYWLARAQLWLVMQLITNWFEPRQMSAPPTFYHKILSDSPSARGHHSEMDYPSIAMISSYYTSTVLF